MAATHIPDLLSFDSWENDTSITMSAASSSSAEAGRTTSRTNHHHEVVVVSIAGVLFSLDASTFDKIRSLPWQPASAATADKHNKSGNSSSDDDDDDGGIDYSLSTSPELFDVLVHHVLFGSLPSAVRNWTQADQEELEVMALSLDLTTLAEHIVQPVDGGRRRGLLKQGGGSSSWRSKAATAWSSRRRLLPAASGKHAKRNSSNNQDSTTTAVTAMSMDPPHSFHMA